MKKFALIACSAFVGFLASYIFNSSKCDFLKNLRCKKEVSEKIFEEKNRSDILETEEQIISFPEMIKDCPEDMRSAILLQAILNLVKSEYVTEISEEQISEKAISGLLSQLDPHSRYISEKNIEQYDDIKDGEFAGIGTTVTVDENFIRILSVLEDTPAYKAGLTI